MNTKQLGLILLTTASLVIGRFHYMNRPESKLRILDINGYSISQLYNPNSLDGRKVNMIQEFDKNSRNMKVYKDYNCNKSLDEVLEYPLGGLINKRKPTQEDQEKFSRYLKSIRVR